MRSWLFFLVLAIFLSTISVALWVTGGFATTVLGVPVSAHSPRAAAVGAVVALAIWVISAGRARSIAADLDALSAAIDRGAGRIIVAVAALAGAVAVRFHTFSASGSDPSGYLSEAAMLASGALSYTEPVMAIADWPDAASTLAPLGWQASGGATQVPTYAVGLPLLMAVPHAAGGVIGASLVVCVSAALAVWFAGRTAMVVADGSAGVLASVWVATLPVHLYESMQPMSDVPVTAAWLACWWWISRSDRVPPASASLAAGTAAAAAALIRPNLAPLAAVPALFLWARSPRRDRSAALWFALPVAAAGTAIAYLQWRWFGSPLRSGYGSASEIYSLGNLAANSKLYFRWLVETHSAALLIAPFALLLRGRSLLRWMLAFAALVCVAYFLYGTFEAWPYLRFLLPALALAAIAASVLVATGARRLPSPLRAPILLVVLLALSAHHVARARELGVFNQAARQSRAMIAGRYLAAALPQRAVLISGEQSGAMRYYTGRSIVRWDFLDAETLPLVQQRLASTGHDVWIVLDDWEVSLYREKFRSTPDAALDWPPAVDAGSEGRTQAWRLSDRARFHAGARVLTHRLR